MGQAVGDVLPFAVGVAISPVPIIAVIAMLLSARGATGATAFLVGWVAGVVAASAALLALSGVVGMGSGSSPSTASSIVRIVFGVLLCVLARRRVRRHASPAESGVSRLLQSVDALSPAKTAGLGVALSALNPKNLIMVAGAMVALSQRHLAVGSEVVVVAVFVVVAVSTVAAPVLVTRLAGARAERTLAGARGWLDAHGDAVMAVLLVVIGVVLIGKGIGGLS